MYRICTFDEIAERGIAGVRQVDDEGFVWFVVGVAVDGDDD